MKLVHFSDLHLDSAFSWTTSIPHATAKRRQALRDTLVNIVSLVADTGADALLCGGDLYEHLNFTPDTEAFLKITFERLQPIPVFIAPGNHDWYGPQSLYQRVDWSTNVHVFSSDKLEPVKLDDGVTLWGAAHLAPANTSGFLDDFKVSGEGVHLALFHGSEKGWFTEQDEGKAPHAPFDADQIAASGLHHAFLGHYHRPRNSPMHTYPGNPDPLAFGEDGDRGAVVASVLGDGTVERERVRVAVTEVHDVNVDVSGAVSQQDIRDRMQSALGGLSGSARATLIGELATEIDFRPHDLPTDHYGLDSVLVEVGDMHIAYNFEDILKEQTIRGEFVRAVLEHDLTEEEQQRVLVTGLRALDGRDDLEVT